MRHLEVPAPGEVPEDADTFLASHSGPTAYSQSGRDRSRLRVVVTLLHGNEPSGLRAVHAWLRSGLEPATDAVFVLAAIEAARRPPGFAHRMLPGARDLNRCFRPPWDGPEGALAREIRALTADPRVEAVVDIHNNTGHNPSYGVGPKADPARLSLVAAFGNRYILNDLRVGALIEELELPAVVVEVGRAGDPAADAVARRGLAAFLESEAPADPAGPDRRIEVLIEPLRVCVRAGVSIAYGEAPAPGADFTLRADVDRHNFESLPAGVSIGWMRPGGPWPLEARGADGVDRADVWFAERGACIETRRPLVPIMMTTDPAIAMLDCLFYAVQPASEFPARSRPRGV
jgi:hypothetical protein